VNRESRPPATGTDPSPAADEDGAPEAEVPRGAGRIGSRWTNERELADAIHGTVVGAAVAGLVTIDPVSGSPPVQARRSATSSPGLAAHGGI
jgi:hypothetical protein